ncbi:MAG: hypothetical protein CMM61_09740 [Rhodospirillaceae bacterium]|nr:hypothetical protein [Rhodospirillaceae bacterium]
MRLLFVFLIVIVIASLPSTATRADDEAAVGSKELSLHDLAEMKIDEKEFERLMSPGNLKRDVPDLHLVMAVLWHETLGVAETARELGRNYLRSLVLLEPESKIAANRTHVAEQNLSASFQRTFDDVIEWNRRIRSDNGRFAYAEMKRIEATEDGAGLRHDVAEQLLFLAARLGFGDAKLDQAHRYLGADNDSDRLMGALILRSLAVAGNSTAQLELGRRHSSGDGLEADKAKAYYWYLRARENGSKVTDIIAGLERSLNREDRTTVRRWIDTNDPPVARLTAR